MTIAFDLLLDTYRRLGTLKEGTQYVAGAGSNTTTIACTALTEANDYWIGGCALIITDAAGAGAAPEDQSRDISDSTASTSVVVGTAFSQAVASGDTFGVATPEFPRSQVLRALNDALMWYGPLPTEDASTLNTAASTLDYDIPAAALYDLRKVLLAPSTATPQYWEEVGYWYIDYGASHLHFEYQPPVGYDIKLVYYANHASLTADSTAVNGLVFTPAIIEYAYAKLIEYSMQATGKDTSHRANLMNDARAQAEAFKRAHPVPQIVRTPHFDNMETRPGGVEGFRYILP